VRQPCPTCGGVGEIIKEKCQNCGGSGLNEREREISIAIPAGVENGQRLRVAGEGEGGTHGGPPGDLYVDIIVERHELFERDREHLVIQLPVSFTQAALGAEVEVPTLNGTEKLKIPAGTQSGTHFRIKRHGMPIVNSGGRRGDLYVVVNVKTPTKLNKEQKKLFEQLAGLDGEDYSPGKDKSILDRLKELFG
jgi:molecular chaperone DnaJ